MAITTPHKVDQFAFEFWEGDPPARIRERVQKFDRAGTEGSTFRTLGKRGESFECQLTSWHQTWVTAREALKNYTALVGQDPVEVRKDGDDLLSMDGVKFVVMAVDEISIQTNVRLLAPGKNYAGGVALVTRWTMAPVEVPTT